jgi:PAS domain S-box-containing protein
VTAEALERFLERATEPALILDPAADRLVAVNRAACTMLGYTRTELLATPVSAIHRGELAQLQAVVTEVIRCGHTVTHMLTCRVRSGECLPAEMSLSTLELDGRTLVVSLVHDKSQHRR